MAGGYDRGVQKGKHLPSVSMKYVNVVIDHNSRHTDTYYTYSTEEDLRRGSLVQVPFNRGNKLKTGYVFETDVTRTATRPGSKPWLPQIPTFP